MDGKILYDWPDKDFDESLRFTDSRQLGNEPYDVVIVGAGVVGCGLAYKLSQYQLRILLIDKNYDVGEGASKGNSAIVHSGFDAQVGSLESQLVRQASNQWPELAEKLKIPYKKCGAMVLAIDDSQQAQLDKIYKKALSNGVDDVELLTPAEARELESNISRGAQGGLLVPGEAIGDPFVTCIALAEVALANGVDILLGAAVISVENAGKMVKTLVISSGHRIDTRFIVNAAGLGSRRLADLYGGGTFEINPRRGQFLIFDKCSNFILNRILLPIPTSRTKGVLVIPTIFGNLLAGPTAEDFPPDCEEMSHTTIDRLQSLLADASLMLPSIIEQPVIGTYAGVRCHCHQGSYFIRVDDGAKGILTVTGIRSTGFTSFPALADYLVQLLADKCELSLSPDANAVDGRPESSWPGWWSKPIENTQRIKERPEYGQTVCFCEHISRGEIIDALDSPLKPRTLDAIKRRTRALTGRCQSFECQLGVAEIISRHFGMGLNEITKYGPGTAIISPSLLPDK